MADGSYDVRQFGARGDGEHLDTEAIRGAVEKAAADGGGTVVLSKGVYLSFSIPLKSNVTMHLERGAVLMAAGEEPPGHELILAMLTGEGTLPGGGKGDAGSFYAGDRFGEEDSVQKAGNPPAGAVSSANAGENALSPPASAPISLNQAMEVAGGKQSVDGPGYDPPEENPHNQYQDHGHSHWHNSLIWGDGLENVAITGEGMVDGRGLTWNADPAHPTGNKAIALKRCRNVVLRDFTIFRGGHFAVLATGCRQVTIDHVTIDSNRDGLDIDSCQHVTITHCNINTPNDDAIVLKSSYALGEALATEDVTISGCRVSGYDMGSLLDGTFRTTQRIAPDRGGMTGRIKFGTESNGGFRRITISDCVFMHCRGLAIETVDGGPIEEITVKNVTMKDVTSAPLFIRLGNRARGPAGTKPGIVRRIKISNVIVEEAEPRYASLFCGLRGHPIEDVELTDIQIRYRGGGASRDAAMRPEEREAAYPEPNMFGVIPAYGLYCRHVRNLRVRNVMVSYEGQEKRPPVVLEDVHGASFDAFLAQKDAERPIFSLKNVTELVIRDTNGIADTHIEAMEMGMI